MTIQEMIPEWQRRLEDRGLWQSAQRAAWLPNGTGWLYPVHRAEDGTLIHRWKAYDSSAKPKYAWPDGKPDDCKYYLLPSAREAIQDTSSVYIASGEPDVLAFMAGGIPNTLCWFGESNVPSSLAADLREMGVLTAYLFPDRDNTGRTAAIKVKHMLAGSGIQLLVYELPERLGDKGDINKLWLDVNCDIDDFVTALISCDSLDLSDDPVEQHQLEFDDFPPAFYEALDSAMHARGVKRYDNDGWSNLIRCIMTDHEHDDERPAGSWHLEKHIFKCFKCAKSYLAKEVGDRIGVDWRDFVPKKRHPARDTSPTGHSLPEDVQKPLQQAIFSWRESTASVLEEIEGNVDSAVYEPLPMPFGELQAMGGFAYALPPRKMLAVVGDSGAGKTSLAESIVDHWRKKGFTGVMWGPEWSHTEYVYRAIQREGGPSLMQMIRHKAWHAGVKRGLPEEKRFGQRLNQEEYELAKTLATEIKNWPGQLYFIQKMGLQIEELLEKLDEAIAGAAVYGERVSFIVADYAQLFRSAGNNKANDRIDKALSDLKGFIVDRDLVGVVGSQVTKQDGRSAANGNTINQASMMNARSDYFNLALIINREMDEAGHKSPNAVIRVAKNSLGKEGDIELQLREDRMRWYGVRPDSIYGSGDR